MPDIWHVIYTFIHTCTFRHSDPTVVIYEYKTHFPSCVKPGVFQPIQICTRIHVHICPRILHYDVSIIHIQNRSVLTRDAGSFWRE